MTERLTTLASRVSELYLTKHPSRCEWADWLYPNHVLIVQQYAKTLAETYHANEELTQASALLHDIADAITERNNPKHARMSADIAIELLTQTGYTENEIQIIVHDALRFHSCHGREKPKTKEGKILATADALAHLQTDFYLYALWALSKTKSLAEIKAWTLTKLERDYHKKIFFEDVRKQTKAVYTLLKQLYSFHPRGGKNYIS